MSSWRRYSNEQKPTSKYNQKSRSENLRSVPANVTAPISYNISKSNTSFDINDKSVRLTINFDIEPQFLNMFERTVEPVFPDNVTESMLPEPEPEPEPKPEPKPVLVTEPVTEPVLELSQPQQQTRQWQLQQTHQIIQPQYIRQPNTLVGLYNNMNTGVVTVVRSPRIAKPYH